MGRGMVVRWAEEREGVGEGSKTKGIKKHFFISELALLKIIHTNCSVHHCLII